MVPEKISFINSTSEIMKVSESRMRSGVAIFWTLFAASWISLGYDFAAQLIPWDEEIYYNAAINVFDGHWVIPRLTAGTNPLGGVDQFLEKPPLAYWIIAIAMAIGGETPAVARYPSLIAISCVIGLTTLLAWRLSRPATGVIAGFVALGIPAFSLVRGATSVATDPYLLLFGTGAMYSLVLFVETDKNRWVWIAGFGYGAAVLTKFVAAAPFGLFALGYLFRYRERVEWQAFSRIVIGGIIIAGPWFSVAAYLHFQTLLDQMILEQTVSRAQGGFVRPGQPTFLFMNYPYLKDFTNYFGWPSGALIFSLPVSISRKKLVGDFNDADVFMWPFAVGVIVLYAVVGGNHQWYVMPAAIPIGIIVADTITTMLSPVLENIDIEITE
jgi:4-amino-4-deoxy-L-arabinose transferase-like glycosyltransferase